MASSQKDVMVLFPLSLVDSRYAGLLLIFVVPSRAGENRGGNGFGISGLLCYSYK